MYAIGARMKIRTVRTLLVAGAAALAAACAPESSPEQQVRAMIAEAEQAAERRDLSDVMAFVSESYADGRGFDKAQLKNFIRGYFVLHPSIHLAVRVQDLRFPADGLAQARVTVGMLGTRTDGSGDDLALAGDIYDFDVELVREGDQWRLLRADYRSRGR